MISQIPYQIISRFGNDWMEGNGVDEVRYYCPYCESVKGSPDHSGHLYVNTTKLTFICHRCGTKGSVKGYIPPNRRYDSESKLTNDKLIKELKGVLPTEKSEFPYKISYKSAVDSPSAKRYLNDRGFDDDTIRFYDMRVESSMDGKYYGRVIIPNRIYHRIYTDMFCSRTYINQEPKYKNPVGDDTKSTIVFNLHRVPDNVPIIICEGALSAIAAGRTAVASYGKYMSDVQISKVLSKHPSAIFVSLDPDAIKESDELCRRIYHMDPSVSIRQVIMPDGEDPASLTKSEYARCLKESKTINILASKLMHVL